MSCLLYFCRYYYNQSSSAYPWLSYYTLCSEQQFEVQEGIWKTLLVHLKTDNISVDVALKVTVWLVVCLLMICM